MGGVGNFTLQLRGKMGNVVCTSYYKQNGNSVFHIIFDFDMYVHSSAAHSGQNDNFLTHKKNIFFTSFEALKILNFRAILGTKI